MSTRTAARLAWSLWALALALAAVSVVFLVLNAPVAGARNPVVLDAGIFLLAVLTMTVGALIAARRPGNPIGWIFCVQSLFSLLAFAGDGYAVYALTVRPGALPAGAIMAWLALWFGGPVLISLTAFIFLLFPDGRLPSRRWRPVVWANLAAIALAFAWGFTPGPLENSGALNVANPFGIEGAGAVLESLGVSGFFLMLAVAVAGALSLVLRLRRARGVERQQLKWFVFAGAIFCAVFAAGPVLWSLPPSAGSGWIWPTLFLLGTGSIPVATGIAILRHNLFDIDRIINRALVYGSLTATLVLVYVGYVISLGYLLRALAAQDSQLVVVASTLAIAALFNPLRRRVQSLIDRIFYRRKYDAAKTLEAFSSRARDEADPNALSGEMLAVVRQTVQPEHVSLWLRPAEGRPRETEGPIPLVEER